MFSFKIDVSLVLFSNFSQYIKQFQCSVLVLQDKIIQCNYCFECIVVRDRLQYRTIIFNFIFLVIFLDILNNLLITCEKNDESISEDKKEVEPEYCKEKIDSSLVLLFSHAITNQRKVNHNFEFFEIFKWVKTNISLLDAIKQAPSYVNFFKELVHREKIVEC